MKTKEEDKEPCPKCGKEHTRGEYERWQEPNRVVMSPADVQCECGLALRWSVPFFKTTKSGYVLRVRQDSEIPRIK